MAAPQSAERIAEGLNEELRKSIVQGKWHLGSFSTDMLRHGLAVRKPICMIELTETGRAVRQILTEKANA